MNRMIILHSVLALGLVGCHEQQSASMQGQGQVDLAAVDDEAMPTGPVATMWIKGMACPFCATNLEGQLEKIEGIKKIIIDLGTGKVVMVLDSTTPATKEAMAKAVDNSGFTLDRIEMP
ncbi:MAG: cation transporter [Planctomycetes bacterium]|nr:cation transporter [Planctomycetota bacterium]